MYTLSGTVLLGPKGSSSPVKKFHTAVLTNAEGDTGIEITSAGAARLVVVSGEPLDQEIVQHGPFVMDTQIGIQIGRAHV